MHLNAATAISTPQILLVPYCKHHVPTYHNWMQDPDLQAATASEPLTLTEEYAMQESWRQDHDKLTFIICTPLDNAAQICGRAVRAGAVDMPSRMYGDINLFLFDSDEDAELEKSRIIGEIELMIARKDCRRRGYGRSALLTFLRYISLNCTGILGEYTAESSLTTRVSELVYLRVKINQDNHASISLFKSVGFELVSTTANYFGELELRWSEMQQSSSLQLKTLDYESTDGV